MNFGFQFFFACCGDLIVNFQCSFHVGMPYTFHNCPDWHTSFGEQRDMGVVEGRGGINITNIIIQMIISI